MPRDPGAAGIFDQALSQNLVATCVEIALEILYSARNAKEYRLQRAWLNEFQWLAGAGDVAELALANQTKLATRGHHRVSPGDLMIAATAQHHGAEVVHYDRHFDVIAEVTGQPARWIVPRGSSD